MFVALAPRITLAQIDTKQKSGTHRIGSSAESKTELRPQTITLRLAQFQTFTSSKMKLKNASPSEIPGGTSDLHIDVTDIVSQWSEPHSNFGLVLVGENEDLGAYTETICQTRYVHAGQGAPTLKMVYQ